MLKRFIPVSRTLRIGLSTSGFALLRTSGVLRRQTELLADHAFVDVPLEELAEELRTVINGLDCHGHPTTIILADEWVRLMMVTPPKNATRLQDCRAAAEMRFQTLYGEPIDDWTLAADWDARNPYLACALPNRLYFILQELARECGLTLVEVVPQFIATLNFWYAKLTPEAWFGVVHGRSMTLGIPVQGRLGTVRTVVIPDDAVSNKEWLPEYLSREALRLNLAPPTHFQLCGDFPRLWANQIIGSLTCTQLDASLFDASLAEADSVNLSSGVSLARSGMRS